MTSEKESITGFLGLEEGGRERRIFPYNQIEEPSKFNYLPSGHAIHTAHPRLSARHDRNPSISWFLEAARSP